MSKVYCPVGRYAANPFTIKNVSIRVYCIEELCYYIRHNALFIEDDFFDGTLFAWLEEECDLQSLSRKIKAKIRQEGSAIAGVRELFENVNYCSEKETEETITLLRSNRDMSVKERLKIHGDFFLNNNRIALAAETYQELLLNLDKRKDASLYANTNYNLGVIFARLFMFENAADYFKASYEIQPSKDTMTAYLMTLRLRLSDEQYLKKLNSMDNKDAYECSSIVEAELEKASRAYDNSDEPIKIKNLQKSKLEGNVSEFNSLALKMAKEFKNQYRDKMQK